MIKFISPLPINIITSILAIFWSCVISASIYWNKIQHEEEIKHIIENVGRATIERDILIKQWNSSYGGVYYAVSQKNIDSIDFKNTLPRDKKGLRNTESSFHHINPAQMTRQLYEMAQNQGKNFGRLISSKPINPKNRAYGWEVSALAAVSAGAKEYIDFVEEDGLQYMRMLLPISTETFCFSCHEADRNADLALLGGIGLVLPFELFHGEKGYTHSAMLVLHILFWTIGILVISFGNISINRWNRQRIEVEKKIMRLALFDNLTGLANRTLFREKANLALAAAERNHKKMGLLYVDLDKFKPINDQFGHDAGDFVLKKFAERLKESVRKVDTVARIGGDEFIILLYEINSRGDLSVLIEKILLSLRQPIQFKDNFFTIQASIGGSCYPEDGQDVDALIRFADNAMYGVKKLVRNGST